MATPKRLEYMNFTLPYISFPIVIATKLDKFFVSNPEDLITKKRVGIVKGYSIGELLKSKYPNHKIVDVNSVDEGMNLVANGKLYGFVGALPSVVYSIQKEYFGELKVAGKFDSDFELSVGVRNDDPILFELFQKAVKSIDEVKKQEILNKYISVKIESAIDSKLFFQIFTFLLIVVLLGFYRHRQVLKYNKKLREQQRELQKVQNKLKGSIRDFEVLFDSVIEAVFVFEDRVCIDLNNVAYKMFGYENKNDVIGKQIKDLFSKESYNKLTKKSEESSYELKAITSDSKDFDVIVKKTYAIINSKSVKILAIVDVTDMKNKENLLFQQSKMASMGQMLENIAHQWRQPLSMISSSATALEVKKSLDIVSKDEEIKDLKKINSTAQHLSQTIEDFRNFFKSDKKPLEFSVLKSIEKNLMLLEGMLKNNEIKVIYENRDEIQIKSYENEFTQALINIFYNSKDAMIGKDGEKYIFISVDKSEDFVNISIKDNAGGIDEKYIGNIFEPYFTTKHKSQGTGIGLYMTHEIIQKHMKGNIIVQNSSYIYNNCNYKGAHFIINLPLQ